MRLGLVVFILYCLFATALSADGDTSSTTTESSSTTTTESSTTTTTTTESSTTTTTTTESSTTTTTTTESDGTTTTESDGTTTTVSGGTTTTVSGGTTTTGPTTTTITTTSTTTTSAAQALIRKTAWLVGDPHLYSVKNNYQFCNFTGSQTCLSTTGLSISCTAANVKSDGTTPVTYLSSLSLTFTNSTTKTYTASDPTVALTDKFSDGSSASLSSANTTWLVLTMLTNTSKSSSVSIVDYQTNTTIVISQWRNNASTYKMYNLIVRMTSKDFSTSTGILINGCPSSSRRRRRSLSSLTDQERDVSDACAGMSNSGDINSADICVADTTATGDSSFADATSIAAQSIQSAVSIDASAFSAGVSSFNLGVNLGLFSIALNIFLFFY